MKKLLPGVITAIIAGVVGREIYARGFNNGVKECKNVLTMFNNVTDIVKKKDEEKE